MAIAHYITESLKRDTKFLTNISTIPKICAVPFQPYQTKPHLFKSIFYSPWQASNRKARPHLRTLGDLIVDQCDSPVDGEETTLVGDGVCGADARVGQDGGIDTCIGTNDYGAAGAKEDIAGTCTMLEQHLAASE